MTRPVVIVNPVSSGSELAPAFAKRDVPAIAVRPAPPSNRPKLGFASNIREENFLQVFDNEPGLVDQLRKLNPRAIIAGCESGVPLAEQLAAALTPDFANITNLSPARLHKGSMQEVLAKAGLPVIRTLSTSSADEVAAWLKNQNLVNAPLVLKPPASAGSDNVHHVAAGEDWRKIFDHILATPAALMGRVNETVIVQEEAIGTEYAVDTVSAAGNHVLAHLIRYQKTTADKRKTVFDYTEFVAFDRAKYGELLDYTYCALDALGIRWGAAHSEIMLTAQGPRLIETGSRMCGGPVLEFARAATGSSQLERVVEAYLDGKISTQSYDLKRTVVPVFLSSPTAGTLHNVETLEQLKALKTHFVTHFWRSNGDQVPRTVDFNTTIGIVALAGERAAVFADYEKVRAIEAQLVIEPA